MDVNVTWVNPSDEIKRIVDQHDLIAGLPNQPDPRQPLRDLFRSASNGLHESWTEVDGADNAAFLENRLHVLGWLDAEVRHHWETKKRGVNLVLDIDGGGRWHISQVNWEVQETGMDVGVLQSRLDSIEGHPFEREWLLTVQDAMVEGAQAEGMPPSMRPTFILLPTPSGDRPRVKWFWAFNATVGVQARAAVWLRLAIRARQRVPILR